uniref:Uncharacterized protein n=1 Tax=Rhizophora mucronata TaxID=61149 RepID=A0A2P2NEI2_RHIMU
MKNTIQLCNKHSTAVINSMIRCNAI